MLVVGAGVAGVSAAMLAASQGIRTLLIEKEDVPFFRQASSQREIDPTEFDWPAPHWMEPSIPASDSCPMPLPFPRGPAAEVAQGWRKLLRKFTDKNSEVIQVQFLKELVGLPVSENGTVRSRIRDVESRDEYERTNSFLLDCRGAGEERISIGDFSGFQFWEDDRLADRNLGLSSAPRVLISGGSDGALQDFLRIVFAGKTPREIYRRFFRASEVLHRNAGLVSGRLYETGLHMVCGRRPGLCESETCPPRPC